MPLFRYKALSATGETLDGQMEAGNADEVIVRLQDQGYLPVEARRADESVEGFSLLAFARKRELSAEQVLQFTQQLATLLGAGQPLDRALGILLELPETAEAQQDPRARARNRARRRAVVGGAGAAARLVLAPVREPGSRRRIRRRPGRCAASACRLSRAQSRIAQPRDQRADLSGHPDHAGVRFGRLPAGRRGAAIRGAVRQPECRPGLVHQDRPVAEQRPAQRLAR